MTDTNAPGTLLTEETVRVYARSHFGSDADGFIRFARAIEREALLAHATASSATQQAGDGLTAKIAALYEPTTKDLQLGKLGVVRGGEFHQYTNGSGQSQTAMFTGAESISTEERDANAAFYVGIHALVPEILSALLAAARQPGEMVAGVDRDKVLDEVMQERDAFHEVADKLAAGIASHLTVDIGEHSSANCPWTNALEWIENPPAAVPASYKDSTPQLKIGDSSFESWYEQYAARLTGNPKQTARDAYAAGMGDPLVTAASAEQDEREARPLTQFVTYLNEHCIGQTITEESLTDWLLDVMDNTPRKEPKHPQKSKGLFASSALQVQADAGAVAEHIEWCHQTMREAGFCIDGGKCHRGCAPTDACSRQDDCVPLSGSKLAANWNLPCTHPSPAGESDKRDAERHRWLRGSTYNNLMPSDDYIDAAMSREQSQEGAA